MDRMGVLCVAFMALFIISGALTIITFDWSAWLKEKEYTEVTISELLREPESFQDTAINLTGYLEYTENVHWTVLLPHIYFEYWDSDGDGISESHSRIGFTWVEKNLWLFHIHESPEQDSKFIEVVKQSSGPYIGVGLLPFWYAPDFTKEEMEPGMIYPEEGRAVGDWVYRNVRDHGEMWFLDPDKMVA